MPRQSQKGGANSINQQAGRDLIVVQIAASGDNRRSLQDVQVRVHEAVLLSDPRKPSCYFVNVLNASPEREIQVTHVWFEIDPQTQKHVLTRPPGRVAARSQWETWIEAAELPFTLTRPERLARVKLGDGSVIHSQPREDVPAAGFVPGWQSVSNLSVPASGWSATTQSYQSDRDF